MKIREAQLPGVLIVEPRVFEDPRGFFFESWHRDRYRELGLAAEFVQDNVSYSSRGTLRGLHFQQPQAQGKLVQVLHGEVFDVAVDIRPDSAGFARWESFVLSADNKHQVYIPPGFAHGFCVTSDVAVVSYKCTELYAPEHDGGIAWDDPDIGIQWPVSGPMLSSKDEAAPRLNALPRERLPTLNGTD